jgi:acyl-coenzyme A thioesterase PaaI-like protein
MSIFLSQKPEFLQLLGFKDYWFDEPTQTYHCTFEPSVALTHSNGTIVQGGFIAGMLDSVMAQYVLHAHDFTVNPLTLNLDITYLLSCRPAPVELRSKVLKMGKSIAFTSAEMLQDGILIATASATNKLVKIKY